MQRFGFLQVAVQMFFQINNNDYVTENNPALIKPNTECLLRYSVEQYNRQSILGAFADLYAHTQGISHTPAVVDFKEIMTKAITLDKFIRYNNSYLISVFKPKSIDRENIDITKYEDQTFYSTIDKNNENQLDFLEDTIASYENFMDYLTSEDSVIDHTYLWDIMTDNNMTLIKGGVNLIILEITNNDITDNIKILCPTNSQSKKLFDPRKESFILLKVGEYYEPIYTYKENDGGIEITRTYMEQTSFKPMKKIMSIIQKTTLKYCTSLPSLPRIYKFKKNITSNELYSQLKLNHYDIHSQIINYQGKAIGLLTSKEGSTSNPFYVPCSPSAPIKDINEIWAEDDADGVWNDYATTINELTEVNKVSGGKIPCLPKLKVIEDKLIVGLLTETNQFVQIDPPSENIHFDNLGEINSSNYLVADKIITTTKKVDVERDIMIKKISLETQFYTLFFEIPEHLYL